MLKIILTFHEKALEALSREVELDKIISLPIKEKISKASQTPEDDLEKLEKLNEDIKKELTSLS